VGTQLTDNIRSAVVKGEWAFTSMPQHVFITPPPPKKT